MGIDDILVDVDNYENIFDSRFEDYRLLKSIKPNRKILTMHVGGIVLECLVKYMIIKKKNITKKKINEKDKLWYDRDTYNLLLSMDNVTGEDYINNAFKLYGSFKIKEQSKIKIVRADVIFGHDYPKMIRKHLSLTLNAEEQDNLDCTYNPLDKNKECFIDLRYYEENNNLVSDELFDKWKKSYDFVFSYLQKQLNIIANEND